MAPKDKQRIFAGALGGAIPILLNLVRLDPETMFNDMILFPLLGYSVQAIVLALIGGTVGYYMKEEESLWKTLMIGMTAPAMLTGIINASEVRQLKPKAKTVNSDAVNVDKSSTQGFFKGNSISRVAFRPERELGTAARAFVIPLAAMQVARPPDMQGIKIVKALPAEGPFDAFLRGVVGTERQAVYLISAGEFSSESAANKRKRELEELLRQKQSSLIVKVVNKPFEGASNKSFVLIGSPATRKAKAPKYILDDLKPLVFTDGNESQSIAKSIGVALNLGEEAQFVRYVE